MLSPAIISWGKPVSSLFNGSGKSYGLYSVAAERTIRFVDIIGRFYQSLTCFILGLFHYYLALSISVKLLVLRVIHTTNNNKRLIYLTLVINSRRTT